jgi:hypothetical protein
MQCKCGNKFFTEHKNAISFSGKSNFYFHLFHSHPVLTVAYSIFECTVCRELYICRKTCDNVKIEKLIHVSEFNSDDATEFLIRATLMTKFVHYTENLVSNMVRRIE